MPHRTHAQRLSAFAPASVAHYLEHVWLGAPDACDEPALAAHGGSVPEVIPPDALASRRDALLGAMAALYGGDVCAQARALLSQWSKYYFGLAASAGFAAALLLGRPLDMTPSRMRVVLRDGMPAALIFDADALRPARPDPASRYATLVEHLRATIGALGTLAKLSPRVLWSNAGNLLDYLFEQCAHMPRAAADAAWLFGALDAHGEANPLRLPVRRVTPGSARLPDPFRVRRVCCLRNEIPGEDQLCGSCPLLLTMGDDELAKQEALR
ncbi:siderophore-iron reductase FhuF [Burkholderia sp. TSV86]|uniref:siderophore-iron reductase FhuF n=1 Tax=Burkholderia sp. TSV86 TaxID=1385594 RepID=UPI00075420E2|nr:siderophore-iron reductase FhuF [Burkholderia sp. TSV86]KVE33957.1 iron reductase [Burkholderia sp. TSV86]